ncbi:DUF3883 domain-containing protein [Candidatus Margulisiibacteriota bacterium]
MKSIFSDLQYNQIKSLLEIIFLSKEHDYHFIKNNYISFYQNFEATLSFLEKLSLIRINSGKIIIEKNKKKNNITNIENLLKGDNFVSYLLERLLSQDNYFFNEVKAFMNNFCFLDEVKNYKPTTYVRLKESGIRNFLMELGLIIYDNKEDCYRIKNDQSKYLKKWFDISKISQKELTNILIKKNLLGEKAEKLVLEYEKKRLKKYPELIKNINYIAKTNISAGYDIKSFEASKNRKIRYIEVKAVSIKDYMFQWSMNEIEVANFLGEQYYLYLLPVIGKDKFDINKLEIILNPYKKVFKATSTWEKREAGYCLWKK